MINEICFDMDGTLCNLYAVPDWLDYLLDHNPYPYIVAKPMLNLSHLARKLNMLQKKGYKLTIISWLSKNSDPVYDNLVTIAKKMWLSEHLPSVHWDNINIVPYGTSKINFGTGILFDDEEHNREEWYVGDAYAETEIMTVLKGLD